MGEGDSEEEAGDGTLMAESAEGQHGPTEHSNGANTLLHIVSDLH